MSYLGVILIQFIDILLYLMWSKLVYIKFLYRSFLLLLRNGQEKSKYYLFKLSIIIHFFFFYQKAPYSKMYFSYSTILLKMFPGKIY